MIVSLKIKEVLAAAKAAYAAGELQAQKPFLFKGCLYMGPCAIGAALRQEERVYLDTHSLQSPSIESLIRSGKVITDADPKDFYTLQVAHDFWAFNPTTRFEENFKVILDALCLKYEVN